MTSRTSPSAEERPGESGLRGNRWRFGLLSRIFHWLTPLLLICSFTLIWSVAWLPAGPDRVQVVRLHRTIGIIVLSLTILRLFWRAADQVPRPLGPWPSRLAGHAVHAALYGILLCTPLLGWTYTNARGHVLYVFGVPLPSLIFKDEYFSRVAITLHEWLAYTLLALIGIHILAALWHHFYRRDDSLRRIWRG